jgi:dienelactone hydrolase
MRFFKPFFRGGIPLRRHCFPCVCIVGLIATFAILLTCLRIDTTVAKAQTKTSGPSFAPEVEIQKDDYAKARETFRTKLLREASAPQKDPMPEIPEGVTTTEYLSGKLRLKAWINPPSNAEKNKYPAVLFLHGGFAFAKDDWDMAQPYRDAGFIVLTPMLRGENGQVGSFTLFYDEVEDVIAAADYLSKQPYVDAKEIYVAGHSVGGTLALLAAQASKRFRAAASFSGSPDQILYVKHGIRKEDVPFSLTDPRELQLRSPLAYATSFKCPVRIYYGTEEGFFHLTSQRTAELAKKRNLDVEAIRVEGSHFSELPSAMKQSIAFFEKNMSPRSAGLLKQRAIPPPKPSLTGNTTFRLKGFQNASVVALAGNFNNWNPRQLFFGKENGQWVCRIDLAPGKYLYKFVVDGEWIIDPENPTSEGDGNGNTNSVLVVKP